MEDLTLDLTRNYRSDSNDIEDMLFSGTTDNDDEIILVIGDEFANVGPNIGNVVRYQITAPAFFYNAPLRNYEVFGRWLKSIPASVSKYFDEQSTLFRASASGTNDSSWNSYSLSPNEGCHIINGIVWGLHFSDDSNTPNYDDGSNYSTITHKYTIPFNGVYTFEVSLDIICSTGMELTAYLTRSASGNNTPPIENVTATIQNSGNLTFQGTFDANAGELIFVRLQGCRTNTNGSHYFQVISGSYFACIGSELDGGIGQVFDPADFRATNYDFKRNIDLDTFNNLRTFALRKLLINEGSDPNNDKTAWIDSIVYNIVKSTAKIKLISNG